MPSRAAAGATPATITSLRSTARATLFKLDFLLNGDPVDALSMIVFRDNAYAKGRRICEKAAG